MTKFLGILIFLTAAVVLIIAITNFTPQFSAAGTVADQQQQYGLSTTTTDLRYAMGIEFIVQLIVTGLLAVLGWFLYGSETEQYGYMVVLGVLLLAMVIVRVTPVLPYSMAKLSPGTAFYGVRLKLPASSDATSYYVTLPQSKTFRVAVVDSAAEEGKGLVMLDFGPDQTLLNTYLQSRPPVAVLGSVAGTATIARERLVFMIPKVKVLKIGE